MKTYIFTAKDIEKLLTMELVIEAVENGYKLYSEKKALVPPIVSMEVEKHHGEVDIKSSVDLEEDITCVKIASGYWSNLKNYGLPTGLGTILLFDARNGALLAVMEGGLITDMRTGAAGAVSAKYLARKDSKTAAIIGTGVIARMQLRALLTVFDLEEVFVWGRNKENLDKYVNDMKSEYPSLSIQKCDTAGECVSQADIVITTTASKGPLFKKEDLKPGTHIACIGADMEGKQEIDENIFSDAKIVVDSIDQCRSKGEIETALIKDIIQESDIYAEIGDIILENKAGRTNDEEITVFDSTGMSVQDIATAKNVYRKLIEEEDILKVELM